MKENNNKNPYPTVIYVMLVVLISIGIFMLEVELVWRMILIILLICLSSIVYWLFAIARTLFFSLSTFSTNTTEYAFTSVDEEMEKIDGFSGRDFEKWCSNLLGKCGFAQVKVTPGSGDQGVDIIAWRNENKYAFQCKRYSGRIGNRPVQEVFTGKTIYGCNKAVVMTNSYFTASAKKAAKSTEVELWDRDTLKKLLMEFTKE